MTLSMVPVEHDDTSSDPERRWAVVEIQPDGSLGRAEVVTATQPQEAVRIATAQSTRLRAVTGSAALDARLGLLQAATGHPAEAAATFARGAQAPTATPERQACLGHLALVEAYQGDLRRGEIHAGQALASRGESDDPGVSPARMALDWIQLERAEDLRSAPIIDQHPVADPAPDPWLATVRLLLEARRLLQTRRPDAAVRLLAGATDGPGGARAGWSVAAMRVAQADAMLSAGEPHRALGLLTPLPPAAMVEASVATAAACLAIGDVRGADAVLRRVREALDRAPLAVQLRTWLLQARIAEDRGLPERCPRLIDRALHAATWEGMRTPVQREWHWLRPLVDRDPGLRRTHRDFLAGFRDAGTASEARGRPARAHDPSDAIPAVCLTERELEVLDLLSQMYSTEEIAAAMYVSANTVKTHLKGIFGKLCVNRRVEAVRRGRRLGLC